MERSLVRQALVVLLAGLLCALAVSILTRLYIVLPALYAVESHSDEKDVERVRRALSQSISGLETVAANTGAWDDAYNFVTHAPGTPAYQAYVDSVHGWSVHKITRTHGWRYLDTNGEVVFDSYYDLASGRPIVDDHLELTSLPSAMLAVEESHGDSNTLASGLAPSNLGPLMIVVASILPSEMEGAVSRGRLVIWRHFDEHAIAALEETTQTVLEFIPIARARRDARLSALLAAVDHQQQVVPRGNADSVYWVLQDFEGTPQFLVRQRAQPRIFDDALFSTSLLSQFSTAVLVMVLFAGSFMRSVIGRIKNAQATMQRISRSGDLSIRLRDRARGADEIADMLHYFNRLLDRLQAQERALVDSNRKLEAQNELDPLTGIYNRRHLDRALLSAADTCRRIGSDLAVAMIDIDAFKPYNDNYGHTAGDAALKQVANCLADALPRATDLIARYGGEEFCVVMVNTDLDDALAVADRLRVAVEAMALPHEYSSHGRTITVSIGVSAGPLGARDTHEALIEGADRALYAAKYQGRNRVTAFVLNGDVEQQVLVVS